MVWNLGLIEQFYRNRMSEPGEYERLIKDDPIGRMWAGFRKAEKDFHDAKEERAALGYGDSINPERSAELAEQMPVLLARRAKFLAGLQNAIVELGDQPEPTVRYLESRITGLRRGRGTPSEIAAVQGVIDALESIADSCFT